VLKLDHKTLQPVLVARGPKPARSRIAVVIVPMFLLSVLRLFHVSPSSTISSDMIENGYLRTLALSVVLLFGLFLAFTWIIDPYGVSPVRVSLPGLNILKPNRVDIDCLIKSADSFRSRQASQTCWR
jgi:hypothetical protein